MKRALCLLLALSLLLTGCTLRQRREPGGEEAPRFGGYLTAEAPEGFRLSEYNDTLAADGVWYAVWSGGGDGESADAQLFFTLRVCADSEQAEANAAGYLAMERHSRQTGELTSCSLSGQSYQLLTLLASGEAEPRPQGAAGFAVRGNLALSAELLCAEGYSGDATEALKQFLTGVRYADQG